MQLLKFNLFTKLTTKGIQNNWRTFYCSGIQLLDKKWRENNKLCRNPNAFGPLTNLPDYTFMDGRPTPLGIRQKKRILAQREITKKIIAYSKELTFAKERYQELENEKQEKRQTILRNKLKPKGHLLLINK